MNEDFDLRDFRGVTRLFPLPGVVMFPHVVLPLHVFEPRYRQMTRDALADDSLISIVQVRPDADWTGAVEPELEAIGCLGRILRHDALPDGRFNFLLLGRKRVRLVEEVEATTLYRQARVEILEDLEPTDPGPLRADLVSLFLEVTRPHPELAELIEHDLSPGALCDLLAHGLGLPAEFKQRLLGETDVESRVEAFASVLRSLGGLPPKPPSPRAHPFPPGPPFSVN